MASELKELTLREVSLVDRPANSTVKDGKKTPHAIVALWKRDTSFEEVLKAAKGIKFVIGFPKGGGPSKVQSVIFDKSDWDAERARKWLTDNDFKSGKIDETEDSLRFRQEDPEGYERFRTIAPGQTSKGEGEDMPLTMKEIEDRIVKQDEMIAAQGTEITTLKAERDAVARENELVLKMSKPQMAAYASMDVAKRKAFVAADETLRKSMLDEAVANKREADIVEKMEPTLKAQYLKAGPVEKAALLEVAEKRIAKSEDVAKGDCPDCKGTGKMFGKTCATCDGSGTVGDDEEKKEKAADEKEKAAEKAKLAKAEEDAVIAKREKAQVEDRLTKTEAELARIQKRDRLITFAKRAEEELPHTAGSPEEKGEMLMKMADAFGEDSDTFKKFLGQLKAADGIIAPRFGEVGKSGGPIRGEQALEAQVREIAKRDRCTVEKAWTKVPDECPQLWAEYEVERRQVAGRQ